MVDSDVPQPARQTRWLNGWQSLQTFSFSVGWAVGVPAGALCAIAWGLWTQQGTYAAMEAKYILAIAHQEANDTRLNAQDRINGSVSIEIASLRDRLTTLEAQISPVVVTANVIEKFGSHLGALDGRSDTLDRNLLAEQKLRAEQIANLCAKLAGIAGSSGKKAVTCP